MMNIEKPRDITYCANTNCNRNCERNLKNHTFLGTIISISNFGPDKSGECKCFMERRTK